METALRQDHINGEDVRMAMPQSKRTIESKRTIGWFVEKPPADAGAEAASKPADAKPFPAPEAAPVELAAAARCVKSLLAFKS